jgi:hypothetical protein
VRASILAGLLPANHQLFGTHQQWFLSRMPQLSTLRLRMLLGLYHFRKEQLLLGCCALTTKRMFVCVVDIIVKAMVFAKSPSNCKQRDAHKAQTVHNPLLSSF